MLGKHYNFLFYLYKKSNQKKQNKNKKNQQKPKKKKTHMYQDKNCDNMVGIVSSPIPESLCQIAIICFEIQVYS